MKSSGPQVFPEDILGHFEKGTGNAYTGISLDYSPRSNVLII